MTMTKLFVAAALAAAAFFAPSLAFAQAGEWYDKKSKTTVILFDASNRYLVYCNPPTQCIGDLVETKFEGRVITERTVSFNQGKGNSISLRADGDDFRLVHIDKKRKNKKTNWTLTKVQREPVSIPNLALFNAQWGKKGTRVTFKDGEVTYCFNLDECYTGKPQFVGDRNALVLFSWGAIIIAPFDDGYTVTYDGSAGFFRSLFKIESAS